MIKALDYLTKELKVIEDENTIQDVIRELEYAHPSEPHDELNVFFGDKNQLLVAEPHKELTDYDNKTPVGAPYKYGYQQYTYGKKPNPDYNPPKSNVTFVDAIKFKEIESSKVRLGWVSFTHIDGRKTHMSFSECRDLIPKLIRGWLIGQFVYKRYYGCTRIHCLKVLV